MTVAKDVKPEEIWAGDLLGRKEEALLLQGYLESVASPTSPANRGSFVLAVDAGYGEGKTFFLQRLTKQLGLNHPVAYVDAWKDDLANDPLAAIVATLEDAFRPYLKDERVKEKFGDFLASTARIGTILSWGAVKRLASFAVTEGAVNAVSDVLSLESESQKDARSILEGATSDAANAVVSSSPHGAMKERVRIFREGKDAIDRVKASLSALVLSLDRNSDHPPIFVVIDELDRCRPDYAIKLLEQVKHLFDVPGIIFILGMHAGQLKHSVSAAYGHSFDGQSYLGRFINRAYTLKQAPRNNLLKSLVEAKSVPIDRLETYDFEISGKDGLGNLDLIAAYLKAFNISVRDTERFIDALDLVLAISGKEKLILPYIIPILAGTLKPTSTGPFPAWGEFGEKIKFRIRLAREGASKETSAKELAEEFVSFAKTPFSFLVDKLGQGGQNLVLKWYYDHEVRARNQKTPNAVPSNYRELCRTLGRFSRPSQT